MIRPATKEDYKIAVRLIYETIGSIGRTLAGTESDEETITVLESFFRQPGNRLSYENVIVKEIDGDVAGILVCYHGSQSEELDQPFVEHLQAKTQKQDITIAREAQTDEFYLDTLCVDKKYRGRGLATELISAFEQKAKQQTHDKLSLLVERDNLPAYHLYKKIGFQEDGTVQVGTIPFAHMIKLI
ncbi:GNAT family N-acetyltransferase [Hazenella coriacea]|uniref:Acetyltransferase (GNAT) family protein n=1 Tax=Hazenella coriacea TaxID=1179467 RepID=A0A4R3L4S3_9BACL|nr:GNAT family N-acetyltransferase [Hazenella coriacea]TCS93134.1 acetyltransferase (GNAT) family protein [Hazenella coriacea]